MLNVLGPIARRPPVLIRLPFNPAAPASGYQRRRSGCPGKTHAVRHALLRSVLDGGAHRRVLHAERSMTASPAPSADLDDRARLPTLDHADERVVRTGHLWPVRVLGGCPDPRLHPPCRTILD